jgi:nickel-dependent lactate racemase
MADKRMNTIGLGRTDGNLNEPEVRRIIAAAADDIRPDGRRVLVIIPDGTRTCPLPMVTRELYSAVGRRAKRFDFLIALGTHPPMDEQQIDRLLGVSGGKRAEMLGKTQVFNHRWNDPAALRKIGTLSAEQVKEITGGLFSMRIDVTINKLLFDYDVVLVCGPVFPHEVAGFSGGAKYFFPGVCGEELLNFFHWLGAVITCPRIIGTRITPVRTLLHAATDMMGIDKFALCMVVKDHGLPTVPHGVGGQAGLAGMYFGDVKEAWSQAADLSNRLHVTYVDRPFVSVLSRAPEMYDELWVGAKCMYKLEPVVADGGELIIHAPHIREISVTHGKLIREIGYHVRDYFLAQWDKFRGYPWGVLAHSTHVRGIGAYENGLENPRIRVTLATGIPEALCRKINLGYRDPRSINTADWEGREADGRLYVPHAGEMLYKLKNLPPWQRFE